jgi:hypothetical protein
LLPGKKKTGNFSLCNFKYIFFQGKTSRLHPRSTGALGTTTTQARVKKDGKLQSLCNQYHTLCYSLENTLHIFLPKAESLTAEAPAKSVGLLASMPNAFDSALSSAAAAANE